MDDRVRLFNAAGEPLDEIGVSVARSWTLNGEGRARFSVSLKEDYATQQNFVFGNWLLVQTEGRALPDWVGVIDYPRQWDGDTVEISAYTPERVFSWRRGAHEQLITASAGHIVVKLHTQLNREEKTLVRPGKIYMGGRKYEETITPGILKNNFDHIVEQSHHEYSFRAVTRNGKLTIFTDWSETIGEIDAFTLVQGKDGGNIETNISMLIEDGPIVNDAKVFGEGETWQSRQSGRSIRPNSVRKYGLRQETIEDNKMSNQQSLQNKARRYTRARMEPTRRLSVSVTNYDDSFNFLRIGNVINVELETAGFHDDSTIGFAAQARIIGMSYDPQEGYKARTILEVIP